MEENKTVYNTIRSYKDRLQFLREFIIKNRLIVTQIRTGSFSERDNLNEFQRMYPHTIEVELKDSSGMRSITYCTEAEHIDLVEDLCNEFNLPVNFHLNHKKWVLAMRTKDKDLQNSMLEECRAEGEYIPETKKLLDESIILNC